MKPKSLEVGEIISLIRNDKVIRSVVAVVVIGSLLIAIFFSLLSSVVILTSYILGFVVCGVLLNYQKNVTIYVQQLAELYRGHFSPNKTVKELKCPICTDQGCGRHATDAKLPWKNLVISEKLNDALEQFLNHILNQFVLSWYQNYTTDTTFMSEIRHSIRYASASAITRFLELDLGKIVTSKLIPCAVKHVDDFLRMVQIAELRNVKVDDIAVEYLGKRLHVASSSRRNELKYLRYLSASLIERFLPSENLKCRNYTILLREIVSGWVLLPLTDVLADPNIINSLVILAITYKPKPSPPVDLKKRSEFLENFSKIKFSTPALGTSDLKTILKSQDTLYPFIQFLKKEQVVHLLNFCLDVEAFNNRLLVPDLSKQQLEDLHMEALKLFKAYMDHASADFIGCSDTIIENFGRLLDEGVYNVAKLQTSEPLFQAYEYAFECLENVWLPQYHHSVEFYSFICKTKVTSAYSKTAAKRQRKYYESNQGAVSKLSSGFGKIKGALQTKQPIEGSVYPHESRIIDSDTFVEETEVNPTVHRDMSSWRITIPSAEITDGTKHHLFHIEVIECERKYFVVTRRDQDFYTLKAKLSEFHGENEIYNSPLPNRRTVMPLEMRRVRYEDFLRKLLENPLLKGSDLLHTFLTTKLNFTDVLASSMPAVDLENIYQSVAYKFRKEKGQHLDPFMNTFLNSTGKQKAAKFEWAEMGDEVDRLTSFESAAFPKTMNNKVFKNNYGVNYTKDTGNSSISINHNGITDSVFYLLKHIFKVPMPVLKMYAAICSVAQPAVESLTTMYIDRKIKAALPESTLAYLVKELEYVIFVKHVTYTPEQLEERKARAFSELEGCVSSIVAAIFGEDLKKGAALLLEILQNPAYNKQLVYNLLDIVFAEMYPELDSSEVF